MAAVLKRDPPACSRPCALAAPSPWDGENGDDRLRTVVAFLSDGSDLHRSMWPLVATYFPGRAGLECRTRWMILSGASASTGAWAVADAEGSLMAIQATAAGDEAGEVLLVGGERDSNHATRVGSLVPTPVAVAEPRQPLKSSASSGRPSNAAGKRPRQSAFEPPPGCCPPRHSASQYVEGRRVQSADGSTWEVEGRISHLNKWS